MLKAVLFDLDDTLYREGDFFRSGFAAVARELEKRGAGKRAPTAEMLSGIHFGEGREQVFQKAAARVPFPETWIPDLVDVFRSHVPTIGLEHETVRILESLHSKYRLGCITDGWADVQHRKIEALGVSTYLDALVVCDEMGRERWKPHPQSLHLCCELLGVAPAEAVFVGDNPDRDMKAAHNAEIPCIRLRRRDSYFRSVDCRPPAMPVCEIASLRELESVLERRFRAVQRSKGSGAQGCIK